MVEVANNDHQRTKKYLRNTNTNLSRIKNALRWKNGRILRRAHDSAAHDRHEFSNFNIEDGWPTNSRLTRKNNRRAKNPSIATDVAIVYSANCFSHFYEVDNRKQKKREMAGNFKIIQKGKPQKWTLNNRLTLKNNICSEHPNNAIHAIGY